MTRKQLPAYRKGLISASIAGILVAFALLCGLAFASPTQAQEPVVAAQVATGPSQNFERPEQWGTLAQHQAAKRRIAAAPSYSPPSFPATQFAGMGFGAANVQSNSEATPAPTPEHSEEVKLEWSDREEISVTLTKTNGQISYDPDSLSHGDDTTVKVVDSDSASDRK